MSKYIPKKSELDCLIKEYTEALMGFYGFNSLAKFKTKHPEIIRSFEKIKTDSNITSDDVRMNMAKAYYRTVRDLCLDYK